MSEQNGNSYVEEDDYVKVEEDDYIKVIEKEDSDFIEFPKEEDGTVLLRTIQTQFSNAIGIKFKSSSGAWRAVREVDNALIAPKGGWGDIIYSLTFSETKKRKGDSDRSDETDAKINKSSVRDMVVVGLAYKTTDEEMKKYFEDKYGEIEHCHIKYDRVTGKSRGFGFIRFKNEESAKTALSGEDYIDERRVQVRERKEKPMKMFVSGIPEGTTEEDISKYFSKFGEIIDTYIPKPFRHFGFFTFGSTDDGRICLRQQHTLGEAKLKVKPRTEKVTNSGGPPGGFGNRPNSSFTGGYNTNAQQYNRGRNMPSHPPQFQARNDRAAELKNMLFQFLAS